MVDIKFWGEEVKIEFRIFYCFRIEGNSEEIEKIKEKKILVWRGF